MKKFMKMFGLAGLTAGMMMAAGCGDDDVAVATKSVNGVVTQAPVKDAKVFIDYNGNGSQDSNEPGYTSLATGAYTIAGIIANSNAYITTSGGTDTLTNKPAIAMLAPITAANVTPLTTMVAVTPIAQQAGVIAGIQRTGINFDANIATQATPAALNLAKSVELIVQSLGDTVKSKVGTSAAATLQIAAVQKQALESIAATVSTSTQAQLTAPGSLATLMIAATTNAITKINTANSDNINIPVAQANTIATVAVTQSTTAVLGAAQVGSSTAAPTTGAAIEATVFAGKIDAINTAVTAVVTAAAAASTISTTPTGYTPPVITPPAPSTTTGSTGGTGGTTVN